MVNQGPYMKIDNVLNLLFIISHSLFCKVGRAIMEDIPRI